MAKSLQDQLLAAGLVDKKKAKKAAKDLKKQDHLQRTGQDNELDRLTENNSNIHYDFFPFYDVCL